MAAIGLEEARRVIEAAQARAAEIDKPITVVVVDSAGFPVAAERMDGARPLQIEIATAKAYTAAVMQRPGSVLKGWADSDPAFFAQVSQMGHKAIVATGGAYPVKRDGELIGGLGISGGTGDEDEALARATLEGLGYELDFAQFNRLGR
jgi:uncharacterized protein GlcG (DUF336 family)